MNNVSEVFERIRVLYNFKNLTDLSLYFGKSKNWAGQMAKRNTVQPYELCDLVRTEKSVTMDWLLYGSKNKDVKKPISKKEFIENVKDCFYESWELDLIPDYPKESMSAISILFVKNFSKKIDILDKKEKVDSKRAI